jgi:hypothetical protein
MPSPLRAWFATTSAWSRLDVSQNHVLDTAIIEDGKLLVWVENQGVWEWGVDPDGDDPDVYDRENEPGTAWQRTGVRLSTFLIHVAVFEAIFNARHGASTATVSRRRCQDILAPLRPIPHAIWRWPTRGSHLLAGDGVLALAGPWDYHEDPEASDWEVFLAARDHSTIEYLADLPDIEWAWWCGSTDSDAEDRAEHR